MNQWIAAIVVLFLEGPGWHHYKRVAARTVQLGLVSPIGETFERSVNRYFRKEGRGRVEHLPGRTGLYRISARPETMAWCEGQIRNNPHYFRKSYPRYFTPIEPPQPPAKAPKGGKRRRVDPLLRCKVEKAAVELTTAYYRQLGYRVESHEPDNVGWDLLATRGSRELKLEVKGLSGSEICVELTPNEYAQMRKSQDSYHVCVVTDALSAPKLAVFRYCAESGKWQDDRKRTLRIAEIVAARCSIG